MNYDKLVFCVLYYGLLAIALVVLIMCIYEYKQIRKKRKDDKK